ncbi:hypothetical protein FACS1894214_5350 [Planctomycetales bacterium]|nr:hypothetical protein FACS1894214_5350 [Planctomycetales bacterium]
MTVMVKKTAEGETGWFDTAKETLSKLKGGQGGWYEQAKGTLKPYLEQAAPYAPHALGGAAAAALTHLIPQGEREGESAKDAAKRKRNRTLLAMLAGGTLGAGLHGLNGYLNSPTTSPSAETENV